MNLSFFDQFSSPHLLGIPLVLLSLLFPALLFPSPNNRWVNNRLAIIQLWLLHPITKQLMIPLNKNGHKWVLMLTSLMIMLLTVNLLGLLPYTFTPTTQLSMNMALAFPLWLATLLTGLWNKPSASLAHLMPEGTPTPLIPIETTKLLIRPLVLGVRLTANLTARHLLIHLISTASIALVPTLPVVSTLTMIILLLLTILEMAVAMIQAYVFVLLLSLYLQENI